MFKKSYNKVSIKAKLIIIAFILLLYPIVVMGLFGFKSMTDVLKDKSFNYSKSTVDELSTFFSDRIEKLSSYSFQILYDDRIYEANRVLHNNTYDSFWENEFERFLKSSLFTRNEFTELLVYFKSSNKTFQVSKTSTANTDSYYILDKLFDHARRGMGKPVWYIDQKDGQIKGIYLTKVVYDVNTLKTEIALLVFKIDKDQLFKIFDDFTGYLKQNVSVVNEDNVVLYKYNVFEESYKIPQDWHPNSDSNITEINTARDKIYLIFNSIPAANWKMVISISSNMLLKEVRHEASIVLLLCLLTLPIVLILINFLYIDLIRPMNLLIKKMVQIEKGNLGVTIDSNREDELGYVFRTFNNMSEEIHNLVNRVLKVQIAMKDAEIKALQAQINPHFLYNTLEAINWKAKISGVDEISEMVTALSSIIEANLNRSNQKFITIEKEQDYINNYILLVKKRFGSKISFTADIREETLNLMIPKLILQPLIENAIFHGLEMKKGKGTVQLSIVVEEDDLVIKVKDDGIGIDEITLEKLRKELSEEDDLQDTTSNGKIGVLNVHKRIRLLYGQNYGLKITSEIAMGTEVELRLPISEVKGVSG
ncbi:MAG: sensor histidine kinase [Clostridia bacterium]|nr:sensor histidine kinase [Clostridia bacterium]